MFWRFRIWVDKRSIMVLMLSILEDKKYPIKEACGFDTSFTGSFLVDF